MIEIKSNKGKCSVQIAGKSTDVLNDTLVGMRSFFVSLAMNIDEDDVFEMYRTFLNAFNDDAPLGWNVIMDDARERREE